MSEWKTTSIGELCHDIYDGPHATPKKVESGPIFLGISNLSSGRLDLSSMEHLSETDFVQWTRRVTPQENDVVFSYETRLGEAALLPDGIRCCLGRRMALMRPNLSKVDPQFLLYVYLSPEFQGTIQSRTIYGSTVNRIALTEFPSYPIKIPPLPIQKEISSILGNLDRKIENLRKQNETLERIAQTLFKYWFVDFEFPNDGGKPYKLSGGEMVRSELDEIPAGWCVGKLEDICKIINGFAFKSEDYRGDGIKIIRTKNFNEAGFIELNDLVYISEDESKKYKGFELQKFDFLMVMVGASIGKFVIVTSHILPALQNQNMWNFRAINQGNQMFLNFSLKTLIGQHSKSATGSAREFFRKDYFYQILTILPAGKIVKSFSDFCFGIASKVDLNIRQIQTLTQTRDVLLPKLMSGKLRIKD
jgi:type I restriction enzyme S subunit